MKTLYKNLFIFSSIILVYACHENHSRIEVEKTALIEDDSLYLKLDEFLAHNDKTPLIYDKTFYPNFKSNYKPTGEKTTTDSMIRFSYKYHFFGKGNKFYNLFESIDSLGMPIFFDDYRYLKKSKFSVQKFKNTKLPELLIYVDTTQYLKTDSRLYPKIKKGDEYPVYLINNSNLYFYSFMELTSFTILMEAFNKENSQWQPIEYQTTHSGLYFLILPQSYIVSSTLVYDGDYSTKLRLKWKIQNKTYYSNEFNGKINKSQFDTISKERASLQVFHF